MESSPGIYTVLYRFQCTSMYLQRECTYKEDEPQILLKVCIKSVMEEDNCRTLEWGASPVFLL